MTLAYKFLAAGARGSISGFSWPAPGEWVDVQGALEQCRHGVHACGAGELAHWLHDELWIVELGGEIRPGIDCVIGSRGRLVEQVTAWSTGGAARFAEAARDHAAELARSAEPPLRALLEKIVRDSSAHLPHGATALAAFCAAMCVARLRGGDVWDDAAYREERRWQSRFIAEDLKLVHS